MNLDAFVAGLSNNAFKALCQVVQAEQVRRQELEQILRDYQYDREKLREALRKMEPGSLLSESERQLVNDGQYLMATREVRARMGCGLAEAKMIVDRARGIDL